MLTGLRMAAVGLAATALFAACGSDDADEPTSSVVGLANPASEYCVEQGGEVEIVEGDDGQTGVCVLADGTRVDEWEYFRASGSGTTEP